MLVCPPPEGRWPADGHCQRRRTRRNGRRGSGGAADGSGDEVTELRLSVPEAGKRLLPLPVAAWHKTVGKRAVTSIAKGDDVLVHGQLARRFYRSGAGARSITEVVAAGIKTLAVVPGG